MKFNLKLLKSKLYWNKIFESSPILRFIKNNKITFLWFLFISYIYFAIHEVIHYTLLKYFGYSVKYCWTCIPTQVKLLTPLKDVLRNHYFISIIAPYLLGIGILFILTILFLIFKKRFLFILGIIPFLDTFGNALMIPIAYITQTGDDFLNLFKIGFYWETIIIMLAPILIFLILYINYLKLKNGNTKS